MQRIIILLIFLLLSTGSTSAQDLYNFSFKGKSKYIQKLFKKYGPEKKEGVVFIGTAGLAPRPEGMVVAINNILKRKSYKGMVIGCFNTNRYYATKKYVEDFNYGCKSVIDTTGVFFKELNLNNCPIYVTKWNSYGELLYAKSIIGIRVGSSSFHDAIFKNKYPKKSVLTVNVKEEDKFGYNDLLKQISYLKINKVVDLEDNPKDPIGFLEMLKFSPDYKYLVAKDYNLSSKQIFDLKTGEKIRNFFPKHIIRQKLLPKMTHKTFERLEQYGAKTMLFDSFFLGDDTLVTSTTLPKMEVEGTDTLLSNQPVFLYTKFPSFDFIKLVIMNSKQIEANYICSHINKHSVVKNNLIPLVVLKGYPAIGCSIRDTADGNNPLNQSFYKKVPRYRFVNFRTGKYENYIGHLSDVYKQYGTGYSLGGSYWSSDNENIYIAQHLDNKIEINGKDEIEVKSYFNPQMVKYRKDLPVSIPSLSSIDSLFSQSRATYMDIYASKEHLYVGWKLKEKNKNLKKSKIELLQTYDVRTKKLLKEVLIPNKIDNYILSSYTVLPNKKQLFGIYQSATQTKAIFYDL